MNDRMNRTSTILGGIALAAVAGALGGALIGVAESLLITTTSAPPKEYWLFLFGEVTYGLVGAAIGFGVGVLWQIVRGFRASVISTASAGILAGVALPAIAVGRYHVSQRIFSEELVLMSAQGLIAHALILLGALVLGVLAILLLRVLSRLAGAAAVPIALVVLLLAGAAIGLTMGKSRDAAPLQRTTSAAAAGKPNIILIVVDTLRADAAEGAIQSRKGGFASLAADGVNFERTFSQASWTRPSIATILTAEYPSVHGAVHKMDFLPDKVHTLAEELHGAGYWSAAFTTNINVAPVFNFQQGFDEFRYLEPSFYFGATDSATTLAIYKGLRAVREKFFSNRMYFQNYYQDAQVVSENVGPWLDGHPPEPFFLFIHYMDPHDPYFDIPYNGHGVARVMTPDPPVSQAEELHKLYLGNFYYLDDHLRSLFDKMRASGLYDRSVIAMTADHGEEFQEHGGWWHGTALYQEQVHVPLIIKRPGESQKGTRRTEIARSIDIGPTLVSAAGLKPPQSFMGTDLFGSPAADPLFAEEDLEGNRLTSINVGDWKLITANPGNPRGLAPVELYNLADDPKEKKNLVSGEKQRVEEMLAQLEGLRAKIAAAGQRQQVVGSADESGRGKSNAADPRA